MSGLLSRRATLRLGTVGATGTLPLAAAARAGAATPSQEDQPIQLAGPFFDVRGFGARSDGTTMVSPAIDAAAGAGGDTVVFTGGTYASYSVHLKSDSRYWSDGGLSARISMGSEMSGGVSDVFIHDNEFGGLGLFLILKIKTNSFRGRHVQNIYVRDSLLHRAISGMVQHDANFPEMMPFSKGASSTPTIPQQEHQEPQRRERDIHRSGHRSRSRSTRTTRS